MARSSRGALAATCRAAVFDCCLKTSLICINARPSARPSWCLSIFGKKLFSMGESTMRDAIHGMQFARVVGLLLATIALMACTATTTAPPVTGDTIATLDSPPGSNEDFIVNVGRRIFFSDNSAELSDTAKATLDKQAEWLNTYAGYKIKI